MDMNAGLIGAPWSIGACRRRSITISGVAELPLDVADELFVEVEQASKERDGEQQVLRAVWKLARRSLGFVEAGPQVGDVVAQRREARARDLLADEVADQQAEERLARDSSGLRRAEYVCGAGRPDAESE
jgi:hypothetical protein